MLTRFAYIIHSITPLQTKNEIDFSLASIYNASRHANISVEMISDFLFVNMNSSALGCNTTIYVFGRSLDAVANVVDYIESNPDAFADASDTEWI